MDELKKRLEGVNKSYHNFVMGIIAIARQNDSFPQRIIEFMDAHPDASTSDIVEFAVDLK